MAEAACSNPDADGNCPAVEPSQSAVAALSPEPTPVAENIQNPPAPVTSPEGSESTPKVIADAENDINNLGLNEINNNANNEQPFAMNDFNNEDLNAISRRWRTKIRFSAKWRW